MPGYDDIAAQMATGAPTASQDPYDQIASQMAQADTGSAALRVGLASNGSPDQAAVNLQLARRYNTTPEAVAAFPDDFKRDMATQMARQHLQQAPNLRDTINQNPAIASVVHSDLPNAAALEKTLSTWNPSIGQRITEWVRNLFGMPERERAQAMNTLAEKEAGMSASDARQAVGGMSEAPEQAVAGFAHGASFGLLPNTAGDAQTTAGQVASGLGNLGGFMLGPVKAAEGILGGLGIKSLEHTAGESFAKAIARDVVHGAATLGIASTLGSAGDDLNSPDVGTAAKTAIAEGASGALMGGAFGAAGRVLPDNTITQFLGRTLLNSVATSAANGQTPFADLANWNGLTDAQKTQSVFNYGLNALFSAKGSGRAAGSWFKDAARADMAQQDATNLQTLTTLAADSKWRQLDPESFKDFVRRVTEDGNLPNVYVDGGAFMQAMQKTGVSMDDLASTTPDIAKQLNESLQVKGDIQIPTEDYATHIAGGRLGAELLPHLKTDPDGMTKAQADEFFQNQQSLLQQEAAKLADESNDKEQLAASRKAVFDDVLGKLNTVNRFQPEVNRAYAALHRDFFTVLADRLGVTPEQAYKEYGANIVGSRMGEEGLDQEPKDPATMNAEDGTSALDPNAQSDGGSSSVLEEGPFGPIFDQFKGDAQGAIKHLMEVKNGEATGALSHPDIGDIDLVWGKPGTGHSDGYGLSKLVKFHPEVLDNLQEILNSMKVVHSSGNRVQLRSPIHKGAVRLDWDNVAKRWLISAMERNDKETDSSSDTSTLTDGLADGDSRSTTATGASIEDDLKKFYQAKANAPRGTYSPATRTIALLKDANLSTFLHESGHFFLDTYAKVARENPEIAADMQKLLDWFGVKDLDTWHGMTLDEQRTSHEKFAEGFEKYLMEGKAPTMELQPLFARFRAWLTNIYRSLAGDLSPEVRGVMGRMLANDQAIREAEAARNLILPAEKPEHISDVDWANLTRLQSEAHETALDELQSKTNRAMTWSVNFRNRELKRLAREARDKRAQIRGEVEAEVNQIPVYRVERFITQGKLEIPEDANQKQRRAAEAANMLPSTKFSEADLKAMFGEDANALWRFLPRNMIAKDGIHPDMLAEIIPGFSSGQDLVRKLVEREPRESVIEGLTDKRMLEEHGEIATPEALEDAANKAVANSVRARFIATMMKALSKSPISVRELVKGAKEAADGAISAKKVVDINPRQYEVQEARANRDRDAMLSKDPAKAFEMQRAALLNNQLARSAREAVDDTRRIVNYFKRFNKKSILDKMDVDIREQVTDLLERFDFRQVPVEGPTKKQQSLMLWAESQLAYGMVPDIHPDLLSPEFRTHYKQMTMGQLRGLFDTVRSMEKIGRERKVFRDGEKAIALESVLDEIEQKLDERGEKFTDEQLATRQDHGRKADPLWQRALDKVTSVLRSAISENTPQQYKANRYDLHEILGPFQRYVFEPIFGANYKLLDLQREVSEGFRAKAKELEALNPQWFKSLLDKVENHNLMDYSLETPVKRQLTRHDLIGIALHVGNESNFEKLVNGMRWNPEDIWRALHDNMRHEDWLAAAEIGRAAGAKWDDMVAMNRELGQSSPEKIEPRPFMTKFGEMPGWYAPIKYDRVRSRLGARMADEKRAQLNQGIKFGREYFFADTTTNGSMNARSNYHDFIDLNWHNVEQGIHESLRDLAYRRALINVHKIYDNARFRSKFLKVYGPEEYDQLGRWLGRIVNDETADQTGSLWVRFATATRHALVANGVAFRISTMMKHGGSAGAKSVGYLAGGGEKYFADRVRLIAMDHNNQVAEALAKSPELRARAQQQDRDFREAVASLSDPESLHGKMERYGHAGVAYMDFFTAVPTFHAAFDWATSEKGIPKRLGGNGGPMSTEDAIKFADSIVRQAHGSNIETARSNLVNNRNEMVKMLTTLYGFMNNSFGQNLDTIDKAMHTNFGKPELLARIMFSQIVPAMMAAYATFGPKVDGEPWWEWSAKAIGGELAGTVPMMREVYSSVVDGFNSAGLPSWMQVFSSAHQVVKDAVHPEKAKHPIKDVGNVGGLLLPGLGQISASLQFLYDEATGKQKAQTVGEWVHGVMTGNAKPPKH